ncbi:hypothetical protein OSI55_25550, partial [Mycobacterium ulcerans]
ASSSWFCDGCTATTVLVIMRPFRPRHTGADQAAYTLTATVPTPGPEAPAACLGELVQSAGNLLCIAIFELSGTRSSV